jgi:hypothetical protein
MQELDTLINTWNDTESKTKKAFIELQDHLNTFEDTSFEFIARPNVSYSLRPKHNTQKNRTLFAMIDIIDDNPDDRWLSVCFYGEMISDPGEAGDLIPEGLLGEDGYCFDLYEYDKDEVAYLKQRLSQAYENARE